MLIYVYFLLNNQYHTLRQVLSAIKLISGFIIYNQLYHGIFEGLNKLMQLPKASGLYLRDMTSVWGTTALYLFIFLIYFWLCWVFVSVRGLSLVVASGGHPSSRCAGLLLSRPLLLRSTGSRRAGSVIVAHGLSCSAACGIFPDQGSNPCPLHWQADSQPLRHQGSPTAL